MTKEEFEQIIKPLYLMNGKDCQFMRSSLLGNFDKWNESKQCNITHVVEQSEQLCDWCRSTEKVEVKICKKCRQGMDKHR